MPKLTTQNKQKKYAVVIFFKKTHSLHYALKHWKRFFCIFILYKIKNGHF